MHIATPIFWSDKQGNHPQPFTLISAQDVRDGVWKAAKLSSQSKALHYVETLEKNGKYVLVIWPPHCIIGTQGHNIYPLVREAMFEWEKEWRVVDFVTKGSNPFTEHYSVFQADVTDPSDPSTQLNSRLVQSIEDADVIAIAGEALSHCVASSCTDMIDSFSSPESAKKVVLLEDCMSVVPGFEQQAQDFLDRMKSLGVKLENSANLI
jgi:nicotinamidase-related amidase